MKLFSGGKGSRGEVRQPRLMEGQDGYTFRRSRTLTGSLSNEVKTPRSNRPDLKSERLKLHELHQHRRSLKAGLISLMLVSLFVAYLLSNSIALAGRRFEAPRMVSETDKTALEQTLKAYVNRHPLETFLISINEERMLRFVQASHPEVARLEVNNRWFVGGEIAITFRQPIIVWNIKGSRFYVDENGAAFTKHYGEDPPLKVEDGSGFTPDITDRNSIASKRFISYLGQLLGALQMQKMGAVERVIIPTTTRQLDIYLKKREYPVMTHTDRDPYAQAEDIKNALRYLDRRRITPRYVDVRVEGRAFYK